MTTKLTKGTKYDIRKLTFRGWTGGTGTEGYDCWAYFRDGIYLGPDKFGIEPLFEAIDRATPVTGATFLRCKS